MLTRKTWIVLKWDYFLVNNSTFLCFSPHSWSWKYSGNIVTLLINVLGMYWREKGRRGCVCVMNVLFVIQGWLQLMTNKTLIAVCLWNEITCSLLIADFFAFHLIVHVANSLHECIRVPIEPAHIHTHPFTSPASQKKEIPKTFAKTKAQWHI